MSEVSGPNTTATVGIIYPPPEIRNIVDKTASFVAKNGFEFAERIRKEKEKEVKFNFLNPHDPYHAYFLHRIEEFKSGAAQEPEAPAAPSSTDGQNDQQSMHHQHHDDDRLEKPRPLEFLAPVPPITVLEHDVLKLTAEFVARNGTSFLQQIMRQESNNPLFDFLRPQHSLFQYFSTMTEQYRKIIAPSTSTTAYLGQLGLSPFHAMAKMQSAARWERHENKERKKMEEETEAEKLAYQQIDWHDFVIVATVEFGGDDINLPPPVSRESLGARLIEMDRETSRQRAQQISQQQQDDDDMDMDMDDDDMDMDTEDTPQSSVPQGPVAPSHMPLSVDQMPTQRQPTRAKQPEVKVVKQGNEEIKIKQYDPKAARKAAPTSTPSDYVVSPLTGERIPASRMAEHMRINLLDPRWREDKARLEAENKERSEAWQMQASGAMSHLKNLAARRTDIFGTSDVEQLPGTTVGSEPAQKKAKLGQ